MTNLTQRHNDQVELESDIFFVPTLFLLYYTNLSILPHNNNNHKSQRQDAEKLQETLDGINEVSWILICQNF